MLSVESTRKVVSTPQGPADHTPPRETRARRRSVVQLDPDNAEVLERTLLSLELALSSREAQSAGSARVVACGARLCVS